MKNLKIMAGMLAIAICFAGCINESEELQTLKKNDAVESVKCEIAALNANYKSKSNPQTRIPKWLRWLIFGASDVAGAVFGGVAGACSASSLAWSVTKKELASNTNTLQTVPSLAIKPRYLTNIESGSIGYLHNTVIANTLINNKDFYSKSNEEVMNIIFTELKDQTGVDMSNSQKADVVDKTRRIVDLFDVNQSIDEYYNKIIDLIGDSKQKEALEICKVVLDGLQYVDDNDTTYTNNVKKIVFNSSLDTEVRSLILDGVSVADASAKLWNTDDILKREK